MTPSNEQLIRRAYEALNAGDLDAGRALMDTACELRTRFTSLAGRTYRGHEGLDQWVADVAESWEGVEQTPEGFIPVDGERTIVPVRFRARGRGSGVEIDQAIVTIWTVRGRKVARVESYETMEEARAAAGLGE